MKVIIGADHAGFELKQTVISFAREELGIEIEDMGTDSAARCDYPKYAARVAGAVAAGDGDLGILICGTGVGMSVAANKAPGIVAARCGDTFTARMSRAHNDANVLCLGARVIGVEIALDVVREFLSTDADLDERYVARRRLVSRLDDR